MKHLTERRRMLRIYIVEFIAALLACLVTTVWSGFGLYSALTNDRYAIAAMYFVVGVSAGYLGMFSMSCIMTYRLELSRMRNQSENEFSLSSEDRQGEKSDRGDVS